MASVTRTAPASRGHTSSSPSLPTATYFPTSMQESQASYSSTLGTIVALTCALLFLLYLSVVLLTYRYARSHPRGVNKVSGVRLQMAAPAFYMYIVISSLIEVSLASWLLIQYHSFSNSPDHQTTVGVRFLLFCAVWTFLTSGIYSVLFLHPRWAELPFASVGSQLLWILITWLFWVVGAGLLDGALPRLLAEGHCDGVVFCGQLRGLFALAVLLTLTLTAGMGILFCLAWMSAKRIREMDEDGVKVANNAR